MKYLLTLILSFSCVPLLAQDDCACCTTDHSLFDFWIGEWNVFDTTGTLIGENTITKIEDGCIVSEHWRGKGGTTGRSYNYFNPTDSTWNQLWLDNSGSNLVLKGTSTKPDVMVLSSDLIPGQKIDFYRNRITWSLNDDGTISQVWDILDSNGNKLKQLFYGIYSRSERK